MSKTISTKGINLIKSLEGFVAVAQRYQVGTDSKGNPIYDSPYPTAGYGHCGSDLKVGQKITEAEALELLKKDLKKFVSYVNNKTYCPVVDSLNQNQFDALVSICYNCGPGGLQALCKGRTVTQIGKAIPTHYCYSNGVYMQGLANRRAKEQALFNTPVTITEAQLRQKVVNTINAWLGAVEGGTIHSDILKIYNSQNPLPAGYKMQKHDAWCATTVSATWLKVGIAKYICTECSCSRFIELAKKKNIWKESDSYIPKIGDAIIYYWSDNGVGDCTAGADHIGIVTAVNGNSFTVTEGNSGNGSLGAVSKRTMQVNGKFIRGFITPDYAAIAKKVAGTVTADTASGSTSNTTKPVTKVPDVTYRIRTGGKWSAEVKNLTTAGKSGSAITDIAIKVSKGKIKYRVHVKGGSWLPYVTDYNIKDDIKGYAGNGKPIDAIEIYYTTPSDVVEGLGYLSAKYRVSPLKGSFYSFQYDNDKSTIMDGYAGTFGKTIDRVQIIISK